MQEIQETQVQSLVRKIPLKGEMATHSSILAWKISWTEEPGAVVVYVNTLCVWYVRVLMFTEIFHTFTNIKDYLIHLIKEKLNMGRNIGKLFKVK